MKIENVDKEKIKKMVKKGSALAGCALVLTSSLTGCIYRSIGEINSTDHSYQVGATSVSCHRDTITDADLRRLPSTIEQLDLDSCQFVNDLSTLPEICPNIKKICLKNCSSIVDLSFIMRFPSLEKVELNDMAGISLELLEYFQERGIEYNITQDDYDASQKVDEIIDEIITDDMTDEEKIEAVCLYVSENCNYRLTKTYESNSDPLSTTLLEEKGVCAGIAYTTNVLLRKAGIESYELISNNHGWNLIDLDGKYYYLDVTNIGAPFMPKFMSRFLIDKVGFSDGYMSSPANTFMAVTQPYDDRNNVIIPSELVEDIRRGEDEKTLIDRYCNNIPAHIIIALIIVIGIGGGIKLASKAVENRRYK